MGKLLPLCLAVLFVFGRGSWALPAPLNPTMSSVNFKHELSWTAAPGSPSGLTYHVFARDEVWEEVATTKSLSAEVKLNELLSSYQLYVKSGLNTARSRRSQVITFTPYLDTRITAPNVTMSGCGKCIRINISLPKAVRNSGVKDIREIYDLSYKVSWKEGRRKGQEAVTVEAKNHTVTIQHLLPFTEYCVQVEPVYLKVTFEPSPWKCAFTSTQRPQTQIFAVFGSMAGLVVFTLLCMAILSILKYTGIICKLKEAMPHTLITSLWQLSLLRLEGTDPEPVSFLPETGRQQHSDWDEEEDDREASQVDRTEDQEEDQYMDRCADLSSDSRCRFTDMTSSCQSAATVSDHPGSKDEEMEQPKDEQAQILQKDDWAKEEPKECKDDGEWLSGLDKFESVNLLSVTIATPDLECDPEQCDVQPLLHTIDESRSHQQLQESDTEDDQSQMNCYMRHCGNFPDIRLKR